MDTKEKETQAVGTFDACFVDEVRDSYQIRIGNITFILRPITVEESRLVMDRSTSYDGPAILDQAACRALYAEYIGKDVDALDNNDILAAQFFGRQLKITTSSPQLRLYTVVAALGAWHKYGAEGWTAARELNEDNVKLLTEDVIDKLYEAYQKFFRRSGKDFPQP